LASAQHTPACSLPPSFAAPAHAHVLCCLSVRVAVAVAVLTRRPRRAGLGHSGAQARRRRSFPVRATLELSAPVQDSDTNDAGLLTLQRAACDEGNFFDCARFLGSELEIAVRDCAAAGMKISQRGGYFFLRARPGLRVPALLQANGKQVERNATPSRGKDPARPLPHAHTLTRHTSHSPSRPSRRRKFNQHSRAQPHTLAL
jgi:hypothetical protein